MVHRNREANDRGFFHGVVGVVFREAAFSMKKKKVHNPRKFEVVVAEGNLKGCGKRLVVIGCYVPPNDEVPRGRQALDFITGAMTDGKRRHDNSF